MCHHLNLNPERLLFKKHQCPVPCVLFSCSTSHEKSSLTCRWPHLLNLNSSAFDGVPFNTSCLLLLFLPSFTFMLPYGMTFCSSPLPSFGFVGLSLFPASMCFHLQCIAPLVSRLRLRLASFQSHCHASEPIFPALHPFCPYQFSC